MVDRPLRRAMLIIAASPPNFDIELATGRVRPKADKGLPAPPRSRSRKIDIRHFAILGDNRARDEKGCLSAAAVSRD